jgi:hypothetical protein
MRVIGLFRLAEFHEALRGPVLLVGFPFELRFSEDGPFSLCDRALPAAERDLLDVRPSRSVDDAFFPAPRDVSFFGVCRCESALPAELLDFEADPLFRRVLDALDAAFLPVCFDNLPPLTKRECGSLMSIRRRCLYSKPKNIHQRVAAYSPAQ